jgi:hypothetical protein
MKGRSEAVFETSKLQIANSEIAQIRNAGRKFEIGDFRELQGVPRCNFDFRISYLHCGFVQSRYLPFENTRQQKSPDLPFGGSGLLV